MSELALVAALFCGLVVLVAYLAIRAREQKD
jgi:hypothetical protein